MVIYFTEKKSKTFVGYLKKIVNMYYQLLFTASTKKMLVFQMLVKINFFYQCIE